MATLKKLGMLWALSSLSNCATPPEPFSPDVYDLSHGFLVMDDKTIDVYQLESQKFFCMPADHMEKFLKECAEKKQPKWWQVWR